MIVVPIPGVIATGERHQCHLIWAHGTMLSCQTIFYLNHRGAAFRTGRTRCNPPESLYACPDQRNIGQGTYFPVTHI